MTFTAANCVQRRDTELRPIDGLTLKREREPPDTQGTGPHEGLAAWRKKTNYRGKTKRDRGNVGRENMEKMKL